MTKVNVIMAHGALGADEYDDLLDAILRIIADAHGDEADWVMKYGADFENDIFMMHRYCWCEKDDCPWCGGCDCPESAHHYFVDGEEVGSEEWGAFFDRETYQKQGYKDFSDHLSRRPKWDTAKEKSESREWNRLADAANKRRDTHHDDVCNYCTGKGIFATNGAEPGKGAPNFWHKPSGLKVWWYKYIGRDTETNFAPSTELLNQILGECTKGTGVTN
jgi:hypothetical protein